MKKQILLTLSIITLLFAGCTKTVYITEPQQTSSTGKLSLNFNPADVPAGVTKVVVTLTRQGYTDITKNFSLISESTADVYINEIPEGDWHIKIDAFNDSCLVLYTGETDVKIQSGLIVQLSLTLKQTTNATGAIYIFVTWGSTSQWLDYINNPILTIQQNPSSPGHIFHGRIICDNGIYKLWYTCVYNNARSTIWYAESQDAIHWNTIGTQPVLTPGYGTWDSYAVAVSAVIKDNNQYLMFYMSYTDFTLPANIGLAYSQDGINWTKRSSPIITTNSQYYNPGAGDILKLNGKYYLFFTYNSSQIGVATSTDLNIWDKKNIMNPSLTWEKAAIGYPTIIYEDNKFKMVYQNAEETAFGYAEAGSDLVFTKNTEPIFKNTNAINSYIRIAYPHFRKVNNEYRIYYIGEPYNGECSMNFARKL